MRKLCLCLAVVIFSLLCAFFGGCKENDTLACKYEITVEYVPENGTLTGIEKVTFENSTSEELSCLKFALYPNAYRQNALYKPISKTLSGAAYYAGESYGEMVISSVNGAKSWEVCGEDKNVLCVYLEKPLYPDDKVVVDIAFMVRLAKVNHRTGISEYAVNLGNFFPILCGLKGGGFYETAYYDIGSPFYADCAQFTVTVKAPKEYTIVSSGREISTRILESKQEYTATLDRGRDFALVLSERFQKIEGEVNGKKIVYYFFDDERASENLSAACEAFAYYEAIFGRYPYPTYSVVQTGLCMDGETYPALAMISATAKGDKARTIASLTAGQWWQAVVGSDGIENAWQGEGLSGYSALCFLEEYEKYGVKRARAVADCLKEYRSYYDVYGSVLGRTDTAMIRHLKDFASEYEYQCLVRDKSVVMFDTLRKSVGDKKFYAALKKYYHDNSFKRVGVGEMVGAFEKTGLDVYGFFDSFLKGKAVL